MQPSPTRDLLVGLFVVIGLGALAYLSFAIGGTSWQTAGGLTLYASFDDIGGLKERAPVSIAGVKVGQVSRVQLDDMFRARVELDLDASLELPTDSTARIRTAGVLGDQFILLESGGSDDILKNGDEIEYTESALSLEGLVGRFLNDAGLEEE